MIEQLKIKVQDFMHITNCYIVWDKATKEAVVVDPADKAYLIIQKLNELNLKLKYIMLTHAHKDHTIALNELLEKYDSVKVIANIEEIGMLEAKYNDCSNVFELEQCTYDINRFLFFNYEDDYSIGKTEIHAFATPGHTRGSACYFIEDENILLTGDTLFDNCFGRCDLETASIEDMTESLSTLYNEYRDTYIYPGHGNVRVKIEDTYSDVRRMLNNKAHINLDDLVDQGGEDELL